MYYNSTHAENVDLCVCVWQRVGLTCDVDIGRGGIQGCRRPCSAAVAGSDAFGRRENVQVVVQVAIYTMNSGCSASVPGTGSW